MSQGLAPRFTPGVSVGAAWLGTARSCWAGLLSSCPVLQGGSLRPRETPPFAALGPRGPRRLGSAGLAGAPADQAPDSRAPLAVICPPAHFCFVSDMRRGGRKPRATFQSFKGASLAGPGEGEVGRPAGSEQEVTKQRRGAQGCPYGFHPCPPPPQPSRLRGRQRE